MEPSRQALGGLWELAAYAPNPIKVMVVKGFITLFAFSTGLVVL